MALRPRIRDRLTGDGHYLNMRVVAVGFTCILMLALGGGVLLNSSKTSVLNLGQQINSDNSTLAKAVRVSWSELTSQAIGDHENCAVEFHLKEEPIMLDEAAIKYGAYNKDLDKIVMAGFKAEPTAQISGDTEFIEAHSCLFEGRRFAHIVVKHKGRIVSLLMTDTDLPAGNDDVQTANFGDSMNAAGFQTGHHAVFVVSQLDQADNVNLAKAVSPAIRLHAAKFGA